MEVEVVLPTDLDTGHRGPLEALTRQALQSHRFFQQGAEFPRYVAVQIAIELGQGTAIDHSDFSRSGNVLVRLDEFYIRIGESKGERLFLEGGALHARFPNLLSHEFGHFIDARLSPAFEYADSLRPSDERTWLIHMHLWDSFIDARLGELGSHDLSERIIEAQSTSRLSAQSIKNAWSGKWQAYPAMTVEAARLARESAR